MIHLLGGLLLVLGGGALGLGYERWKRREQRCIRETLRALGELRAGVCRLRTPLPLLLSALRENPRLFPPGTEWVDTGDFDGDWADMAERTELDGECKRALVALGRSISRGAEEERAFDEAELSLHRCEQRMEDELRRLGRLPGALGFSLGALLAILLA